MEDKKSREAFFDFLEYIEQKGLIAKATARARKASAGKVLGILDSQEARDVTVLDMGDVMSRFANLQGKTYTPQSLTTYKSRVNAALDDFKRYVDNPLGFKSGVQPRERKYSAPKVTSISEVKSIEETPERHRFSSSAQVGRVSDSILPIAIRSDLIVYVQGLPFDLKVAEAKKIANVIQAMAMDS